MSSESSPQRSIAPIIVADSLALGVFVVAGIRSHHEVGALDLFLRNAIPLEAAWFLVAAVAGAYRTPGFRSLVVTWAVAVPTGLVARSLWVGSPTGARLLVFLGVGLLFTGLFLMAGRTIVRLAARGGSRSSPEHDSIAP